MHETRHNVMVGLTAILAIVSLAILMLLIGSTPGFFGDYYPVSFRLDRAGGLVAGSRVRLNGIDVGEVRRVDFGEAVSEVEAVARVRGEVVIPAGAQARVESRLVGGSAYLDLHVPPGAVSGDPLPTDGTAEMRAEVATMSGRLTAGLEGVLREPMQRVDRFVEAFETLSAAWTEVGANLEALTEAEAGGGGPNLHSVLARADARLAELEKVLAGLDAWVNDPGMREDAREAIAEARALTSGAGARLDRVEGQVESLVKGYLEVADELAVAMREARAIMAAARDGEGSAGRLLNDPALYRNMEDASERLAELLREAKLLILKWKAEGVPVQF